MGEPDWVGFILNRDPDLGVGDDVGQIAQERTVRGEFVRRVQRADPDSDVDGGGEDGDGDAEAVIRAGLLALADRLPGGVGGSGEGR